MLWTYFVLYCPLVLLPLLCNYIVCSCSAWSWSRTQLKLYGCETDTMSPWRGELFKRLQDMLVKHEQILLLPLLPGQRFWSDRWWQWRGSKVRGRASEHQRSYSAPQPPHASLQLTHLNTRNTKPWPIIKLKNTLHWMGKDTLLITRVIEDMIDPTGQSKPRLSSGIFSTVTSSHARCTQANVIYTEQQLNWRKISDHRFHGFTKRKCGSK